MEERARSLVYIGLCRAKGPRAPADTTVDYLLLPNPPPPPPPVEPVAAATCKAAAAAGLLLWDVTEESSM